MFELSKKSVGSAEGDPYCELAEQAGAVFAGERNGIANAANLTSLVWHALADINWVGFYFLIEEELVLGPFQGKVACVRIALDRGVCGKAATTRSSIIVDDVHSFPGHIACDSASNSELVVPLLRQEKLIGVLDLDSPLYSRFDDADRRGMERLAQLWIDASD